jgi:hypothetical protein
MVIEMKPSQFIEILLVLGLVTCIVALAMYIERDGKPVPMGYSEIRGTCQEACMLNENSSEFHRDDNFITEYPWQCWCKVNGTWKITNEIP